MNTDFRPLAGRRGLIVGSADERSSAWRCARRANALGARLVFGCMDGKLTAPVATLSPQDGMSRLAFNANKRGALEAMVETAASRLDGFDFVLHSTAWVPSVDMRGRVTDNPGEGLLQAMRASVHSFARLAGLCGPRISRGGALVTMRCEHADHAAAQHDMARPVQVAFESIVRYLAVELEPWGLRVHAISAGQRPGREDSKSRQRFAARDAVDNCVAFLVGSGIGGAHRPTPGADSCVPALR
jgi:enoyl-[acyl-carrier protein] reductase I